MELAICRKCKNDTTEYYLLWKWDYAVCRQCHRLYLREYMRTYIANKKNIGLPCLTEEASYSFNCKKCKKCKRWKTTAEEFINSNTHCNDCYKPPKTRIIKDWKVYDMMRIKTNRQNPLAKQLYKQSLISNS